jgi:VanZ family protein
MLGISIVHLDAYGHAFLFFAIAMVFRIFQPDGRSIAQYGHLLLFAAVSETLQYFAPTRQPGLYDWLSDVAGITLAFLLYASVIGRFRKPRLRASPPQG